MREVLLTIRLIFRESKTALTMLVGVIYIIVTSTAGYVIDYFHGMSTLRLRLLYI
jgi:hypothetical protein